MSKKTPVPKTNSRFSSLADEVNTIQPKNDKQRNRFDFTEELDSVKKTNNQFDNKKRFTEQRNNNFNRPTSFRDRVQYEIEQREKQKLDLEKSLSDVNSFPDLTSNKIVKNEPEKTMNYIEKLTWVVEKKTEDDWITPDLELIGKRATEPSYIMEKLNILYEKWKSEYIEEYGYDTYEKNYLFEDYDYFDKLEELQQLEYEDEIERENEIEKEENDYYNDYEYYDE
jgi:hypothetical protein